MPGTLSSPHSPTHPTQSPAAGTPGSSSLSAGASGVRSRRAVRIVSSYPREGDSSSDDEGPRSIEGLPNDGSQSHSRHPSGPGHTTTSPTSRLSSIVGSEVFVNKSNLSSGQAMRNAGSSSSSLARLPTAASETREASTAPPPRAQAGLVGIERHNSYPTTSAVAGTGENPYTFARRESDQVTDEEEAEDDDLLHQATMSESLRPTMRTPPNSTDSRERLEWRSMLSSVLSGDILRGESSRIGLDKPGDVVFRKRIGQSLWWQIRAKMRGRSEIEEKRRVEERRGRVVDAVLEEVEGFTVKKTPPPPPTEDGEPVSAEDSTLQQVAYMLQKLALVEALYPTQAAFRAAKPLYDSPAMQTRIQALSAWYSIVTSLQAQLAVLQRWTGTDDLDILRPNTTKEKALVGKNRYHPLDGKAKNAAEGAADQAADDSTFLERISKEENIKKTFEKRVFRDLISIILAAKETVIAFQSVFDEMQLPDFRFATLRLITFPGRLVMESLKSRLEKSVNLNDGTTLTAIIESLDGFRLTLSLAVLIKRQYESIISPDKDGRWNVPPCLPAEYDQTLLNGIRKFFHVLHLRLKDGDRTIYFRETEILEDEWEFLGEVAEAVHGGDLVVAEQFCSLTNKLLVRVGKSFQMQMQATPAEILSQHEHHTEATVQEDQIAHFVKMLDIARMRYRKLQRFARRLASRFDNSAEYLFDDEDLDLLIERLLATGHFLVYTTVFEESGTYIIASEELWNEPAAVRRLLHRAFSTGVMSLGYTGRSPVYHPDTYVDGQPDPGVDEDEAPPEFVPYLVLLSPRQSFAWTGGVMTLDLDFIDFAVPDNRARLIADGPAARLALCKRIFQDSWLGAEDDDRVLDLHCVAEQQAHLPRVQRELLRIGRSTYRLSESFIQSASHVCSSVAGAPGSQDLVENWYLFASDHGRRVTPLIEASMLERFSRLLMRLAISWVKFISDTCDPTDRKTFRWTVQALDYALNVTSDGNILFLDTAEFDHLRKSVAALVSLLISHFDILGARSSIEAKKEAERLAAMRRLQRLQENFDDDFIPRTPSPGGQTQQNFDRSIRLVREERLRMIAELEQRRLGLSNDQHLVGQVLDEQVSEDRALVFLAASASNIALRWTQGGFIGGGANGNVYIGVNTDSQSVMAVKEIRVQDLNNSPALYKQIKDESDVMSMLSHENIVEYYGIEVHRDRVYIFEEYCSGGSLGKFIELGRIEDEDITRVYASEILAGLEYLHSKGVEHRDIKPDNILLTDKAHLKLVDFGAAKIIAKGNKTMARTRAAKQTRTNAADPLAAVNSLAGTPMYMAPEVIKSEKRGNLGSSDIWSMGCVILEIATGRKPWSNLDNEWAIMFHIGIATQHPPLPEPDQLSELGIDFIERCLTLEANERPSAAELRQHPWIQMLSEHNWEEGEEYYEGDPNAEGVEQDGYVYNEDGGEGYQEGVEGSYYEEGGEAGRVAEEGEAQ